MHYISPLQPLAHLIQLTFALPTILTELLYQCMSHRRHVKYLATSREIGYWGKNFVEPGRLLQTIQADEHSRTHPRGSRVH